MNDRATRYRRLRDELRRGIPPDAPLLERMRRVVDAIWNELGNHRPISWVGFYLLGEGEMTLGPRRDKPACSPIGLHGVCGRGAASGETQVVRDVRDLGANYVACDPLDRSEIVVPVRDRAGRVVAVLDADSYEVGAFGDEDRIGLEALVAELLSGLS